MARQFAARLKTSSGTGPERCRVFINDDVVTLICENTLTPSEKTLTGSEPEAVSEIRSKLQAQVRADFIPDVERITGRRVVTAMSSHALEPDTSSFIFILDAPLDTRRGSATGEA